METGGKITKTEHICPHQEEECREGSSVSMDAILPSARLFYQSLLQTPSLLHQITESLLFAFFDAYDKKKDETLLTAATAYFLAYLELQALSDADDTNSECMKSNRLFPPITPTANRLSALLGRWPASPHASHTKPAAIRDILMRVNERRTGTVIYRNGAREPALMRCFSLTISEHQAILLDWQTLKGYSLL